MSKSIIKEGSYILYGRVNNYNSLYEVISYGNKILITTNNSLAPFSYKCFGTITSDEKINTIIYVPYIESKVNITLYV